MARTYRRRWHTSSDGDMELRTSTDRSCNCQLCKPYRVKGIGKLKRMRPSDRRRSPSPD